MIKLQSCVNSNIDTISQIITLYFVQNILEVTRQQPLMIHRAWNKWSYAEINDIRPKIYDIRPEINDHMLFLRHTFLKTRNLVNQIWWYQSCKSHVFKLSIVSDLPKFIISSDLLSENESDLRLSFWISLHSTRSISYRSYYSRTFIHERNCI